jgi:hypothetical protein
LEVERRIEVRQQRRRSRRRKGLREGGKERWREEVKIGQMRRKVTRVGTRRRKI